METKKEQKRPEIYIINIYIMNQNKGRLGNNLDYG